MSGPATGSNAFPIGGGSTQENFPIGGGSKQEIKTGCKKCGYSGHLTFQCRNFHSISRRKIQFHHHQHLHSWKQDVAIFHTKIKITTVSFQYRCQSS